MNLRPDLHLLRLIAAQGALDAASPSGQARRAAEVERRGRWKNLAPGDPCRLTQEALNSAMGDGAPLRLREESTPCRILRIDPDRGLALVLILCPNEGPNTIAQEFTRDQILPAECPEVEAVTAPPAPPPPTPEKTPWRGWADRTGQRTPAVW